MKTNEKKENATKTIEELKALLQEAKQALSSLRLEHSQFKLKNTKALSVKRREIAQIQTFLRRKELEHAKAV